MKPTCNTRGFPLPFGDDAGVRVELVANPTIPEVAPTQCQATGCRTAPHVRVAKENGYGPTALWLCWPCVCDLYSEASDRHAQDLAGYEAEIRAIARRAHVAYRDVEHDYPPHPGFSLL